MKSVYDEKNECNQFFTYQADKLKTLADKLHLERLGDGETLKKRACKFSVLNVTFDIYQHGKCT